MNPNLCVKNASCPFSPCVSWIATTLYSLNHCLYSAILMSVSPAVLRDKHLPRLFPIIFRLCAWVSASKSCPPHPLPALMLPESQTTDPDHPVLQVVATQPPLLLRLKTQTPADTVSVLAVFVISVATRLADLPVVVKVTQLNILCQGPAFGPLSPPGQVAKTKIVKTKVSPK